MLYRIKKDAFFRRYGDIGYIVRKSNFIDRVVDASGAALLGALSRKPQDLETIIQKVAAQYAGVDTAVIRDSALEFYAIFEEDGFIVSGENVNELDKKDIPFSYAAFAPDFSGKNYLSSTRRAEYDTQTFLDRHFKDKPQLISFQIELTSRCNERCIHCYIPDENKINDIEPELFYDALEQCRNMGVLNLSLSGGEPMLHRRFCDFLHKAKEYDFSVTVLSNLTLLNDEIIAEIKAGQLCSVQVSLYSMKPETHDAITQVSGSFLKTRDSILKLIENDIPLQISCPTMKQNKNDYIDVLNWAHENNCRAMTDYIMMGRYDNTVDNLDNRINLDDVETVIKNVLKDDPDYQFIITQTDIDAADKQDVSDDRICGVCNTAMCMVANGNIYPCPGWQGYICGNLHERSLSDILENSPKVKYLRNIRKKDFPRCLACPDRSFCDMCLVRNANENPDGDLFRINEHFCKVAALNRKVVMDWKSKAAVVS